MKKGHHPTTSRKNRKKKVKATYAKAREEAQLAGVIPTEPVGAVRNEVVDPATQDEQRFPGLDRAAIMNDGKGWSVPEHVKRKVVAAAAEVVFERKVIVKDGLEIELPPDRYAQAQASRTLLTADERQWERDKPEEAGKARGASQQVVAVNVFDALAAIPAVTDEVEAQIIAATGKAVEDSHKVAIEGASHESNGKVSPEGKD